MKKMVSLADKYSYRVEWSEEDQCFIGRCLEFQSLGAHGNSKEKALAEISYAVEESITWMKEDGEEIPEPLSLKNYSGRLTLRLPPEIHKMIEINAALEGISINRYILSALTKANYFSSIATAKTVKNKNIKKTTGKNQKVPGKKTLVE